MSAILPHMKTRVAYYYDTDIGNYHYGQGHPMKPHRIRMTHDLLIQYGLHRKMEIYRPPPASFEDMTKFHSDDYMTFLKDIRQDNIAEYAKQMQRFNVGEDCPVFDGVFEFCQLSCGGSIAAAMKMNKREADVCVNWMGGLHHAKKSEASGFCYSNDIVLAILELLKKHQRVLYVDIDIHHGDGVEEAFYSTDRVMTVSFHKYGEYFPGTGDMKDVGVDKGKNYSVNFPLRDGINDFTYERIFEPVMHKVMEMFQPDAIVLQCGADSLSGDRLGCFNLTVKGHGHCVAFLKRYGVPLMLVGGGGYTIRNVSRCWTYETAVALDTEISNDLPFNEYYEYFGPEFKLHINPSNMKNLNTQPYLDKHLAQIFENLRDIPHAPSVGIQPMLDDFLLEPDISEFMTDPDPDIRISDPDLAVEDSGEYYDGDEDNDKYTNFHYKRQAGSPPPYKRKKRKLGANDENDSSGDSSDDSDDSDEDNSPDDNEDEEADEIECITLSDSDDDDEFQDIEDGNEKFHDIEDEDDEVSVVHAVDEKEESDQEMDEIENEDSDNDETKEGSEDSNEEEMEEGAELKEKDTKMTKGLSHASRKEDDEEENDDDTEMKEGSDGSGEENDEEDDEVKEVEEDNELHAISDDDEAQEVSDDDEVKEEEDSDEAKEDEEEEDSQLKDEEDSEDEDEEDREPKEDEEEPEGRDKEADDEDRASSGSSESSEQGEEEGSNVREMEDRMEEDSDAKEEEDNESIEGEDSSEQRSSEEEEDTNNLDISQEGATTSDISREQTTSPNVSREETTSFPHNIPREGSAPSEMKSQENSDGERSDSDLSSLSSNEKRSALKNLRASVLGNVDNSSGTDSTGTTFSDDGLNETNLLGDEMRREEEDEPNPFAEDLKKTEERMEEERENEPKDEEIYQHGGEEFSQPSRAEEPTPEQPSSLPPFDEALLQLEIPQAPIEQSLSPLPPNEPEVIELDDLTDDEIIALN